MTVISSIFLVLSLAAAILVGPQMRQWSWGPSLVLLGISLLAALPSLWRNRRAPNMGAAILAIATPMWFAWRALMSPVQEFAKADVLLLAGAVGGSLAIGTIFENRKATAVFLWGLAILLLLSVGVLAKQVIDPSFSPVFPSRPRDLPSGFFGHYNDGANFLIAAGFLLASAALSSRHPVWARVVWALIAVSGIAAVYFTRSRGGILAAAVCIFLMVAISLLTAKKRSGWSVAWLIGLPFIALFAAGFLWQGWSASQQIRYQSDVATGALDNPIRLSLLDIAAQCIGLSPFSGGGSRSFSWNCYQFWDSQAHGPAGARPEMVHNEFVQSATDYGLVGAGLLLVTLAAMAISALIKLTLGRTNAEIDSSRTFLMVGGLVGLAGMTIQSSFSFVFHIFPGALLLGITLGAFGWPGAAARQTHKGESFNFVATATAAGLAAILLFTGWNRSRVLTLLWKPYFGGDTSLWARADSLKKAAAILPFPSFYKERGIALQEIANSTDAEATLARELALESYSEADRLHPFDPVVSLNRALLLDFVGREDEAEKEFLQLISIEGGAESLFRGHLRYADFLLKRGNKQISRDEYGKAVATFDLAFAHCERVRQKAPWMMSQTLEGLKLDVSLHERRGDACFLMGDLEEALKYYDLGTKIQTGARLNYRASAVFARYAEVAWSERRPSEALARFHQAKQRLTAATELPTDVTPKEKADYGAYLEEKIGFLTGANIQPLKLDGR